MEYQEGDRVRVVPEPYEGCVFHWVAAMTKYCGRDAVIVSRHETGSDEIEYRIDLDGGAWAWDAGCFQPLESPEFEPAWDAARSDLLGF